MHCLCWNKPLLNHIETQKLLVHILCYISFSYLDEMLKTMFECEYVPEWDLHLHLYPWWGPVCSFWVIWQMLWCLVVTMVPLLYQSLVYFLCYWLKHCQAKGLTSQLHSLNNMGLIKHTERMSSASTFFSSLWLLIFWPLHFFVINQGRINCKESRNK